MRRVLNSAAFVFFLLSTSNASSLELNSPAYIDQLGGAGFSSMDTAAIVAPLIQIAQQLPQVNPGPSGLALVWQEGKFNNASVDQQGTSNVGLIRQIGHRNSAAIQQVGNGHQAIIFQQGRNNTAIISQR